LLLLLLLVTRLLYFFFILSPEVLLPLTRLDVCAVHSPG
jgi:hypothetical protein